MSKPIDPMTRFYRHVRRDGACLIWTGHRGGSKTPRPMFRPTTRAADSKAYAHRWIYEQIVGPVPDGYEVDHLCKNILCVDVAHLEAVPPKVNQQRERRAMCRRGLHDLSDPANCRWDGNGRRRGCLRCWLDAAKRRYHDRKGGQ